ncbi:hypothetical protein JMJ35_004108 [Cladonia borealis]|uniref:Uncharacterized protein n=1 Tax=Cladonia borealis TaxID=184061 RepID=A0AA39R1E5_9LECA|nr:hypothetical protein JMJ35_004108 [Cladonia borealis]
MADSKKYTSKLSGKRILIIGGSSGIGYCVAEASLESGASVIISSSNEERIKASVDKLLKTYPSAQGRVSGYPCDLSSPSLESNIEHLLSQCGGKLDHIVFTAGGRLAIQKLEDATLESIQKAAMIRFNAPLLLAKHVRKYLNDGPASSIVLTTGSVSQRPRKDWSVIAGYATGLHGITRNLALDLAPIRVNLVSPGAVLTPLWDGMPKEQLEEFMANLRQKLPTGEIGNAEDVAESYLYAMRDQNCTGSVIDTNGGGLLT